MPRIALSLTRRTMLAVFGAVAAFAAAPLAPVQAQDSPAPLAVVATTGMVADLVRNIAGERAAITQLMSEGVDPHLYTPTRSDIASLVGADLIFYNGHFLEGRMEDVFARVRAQGRAVVAVAEAVDPAALLDSEDYQGIADPHLWMDPRRWSQTVDVVRDALAAADPAHAELFAANAETYRGEILRLDAYAQEVLGALAPEARVLVTAHDAFSYFGDRYGFEVLGIQGISTDSEAGLQDIEALVSTLVDRRIPAVFVETTIADRSVQALVAGAQARGHGVAIGGELFSDAMGAPGTYEGTYIGMMDHNVTTIARALGAAAPERGLNGRLAGL